MGMVRGAAFTFTVLLFLVLGVQVLTMPGVMQGDANAIRKIAAYWVSSGEFGIPYGLRPQLADAVQIKNQWFFENDERQRFYSRWGEMNTLLLAVPELIRSPGDIAHSEEQMVYANAFNILFAIGIALYLALIARSLGASPLASALYVLCCLYGTYVWHYLRFQGYDIFQLFFSTAYVFHFFRFVERKSWRHLIVSQIILLALVHCKGFYLLLLVPSAAVVWRDRGAMRVLAGSGAAGLVSLWTVAYLKFGFFTLTGDAPVPEGWGTHWHLSFVPDRLQGYMMGPKASFLGHFPQLALAVLLWPKFVKRFPPQALFLSFTFLLTLALLLNFSSHGEWCLGPRYFLFILPLLALPVAVELSVPGRRRALVVTVFLALSLIYGYYQWQFNSRPGFLRQALRAVVVNEQPPSARGDEYLETRHDLRITAEFNDFLAGRHSFAAFAEMIERKSEFERSAYSEHLRRWLLKEAPCNFYFRTLCP